MPKYQTLDFHTLIKKHKTVPPESLKKKKDVVSWKFKRTLSYIFERKDLLCVLPVF